MIHGDRMGQQEASAVVAGREVTSFLEVVAGGVGIVVATEEQQRMQGLQERHTLLPLLLTQQTPSSLRPLGAMWW